MPRFYFNVTDAGSAPDRDGTELNDLSTACTVAARYAGALLQDVAPLAIDGADWRVEVTDDSGQVLYSVGVLARPAPCARLFAVG